MKSKVIVIPGNPPARYFYEAWKEELEDMTGHEVSIDYYPSFEATSCSLSYLQQVEDFYLEQVKRHEYVVLIGHSIGGYLALKILEKHPEKIKHCVLLFPFLHSPGFKAKLTLGLLNQIYKRNFLKVRLAGMLNLLGYVYKDSKRLTLDELKSGLDFAFHEHKTIRRQKSLDINPNLHQKITVYYTSKDTWCPKKVAENFHPELRTEQVSLSHNFVVFPEQRKVMNDCLAAEPLF